MPAPWFFLAFAFCSCGNSLGRNDLHNDNNYGGALAVCRSCGKRWLFRMDEVVEGNTQDEQGQGKKQTEAACQKNTGEV